MATIIDWESGDSLSTLGYEGTLSSFQNQSTFANEGSWALEITAATNWTNEFIQNGSPQIEKGNSYSFDFYPESDGYFEFLFGCQTPSGSVSGYGMVVYIATFHFVRYDSGTWNYIGTDDGGGSTAGEWNRCDFSWNSDGSMSGGLFNASGTQTASATASDSTYGTGGHGFNAYANVNYFDTLRGPAATPAAPTNLTATIQ